MTTTYAVLHRYPPSYRSHPRGSESFVSLLPWRDAVSIELVKTSLKVSEAYIGYQADMISSYTCAKISLPSERIGMTRNVKLQSAHVVLYR